MLAEKEPWRGAFLGDEAIQSHEGRRKDCRSESSKSPAAPRDDRPFCNGFSDNHHLGLGVAFFLTYEVIPYLMATRMKLVYSQVCDFA